EQNERTPEKGQLESTEWHTIAKKDRSPHRSVAMISDLGTFHPCKNLYRSSQPTEDIDIVPSLLGVSPRRTGTPRGTNRSSQPTEDIDIVPSLLGVSPRRTGTPRGTNRSSQPTEDIDIVPSLLGVSPRRTGTPRGTTGVSHF